MNLSANENGAFVFWRNGFWLRSFRRAPLLPSSSLFMSVKFKNHGLIFLLNVLNLHAK
jgi:hypothetical protein